MQWRQQKILASGIWICGFAENSNFIVIIVINSCQSAPLYNQNGFPISRKANKERHGFGIKSINKVVQQYQGNLEMYYDITSGTFHTLITLKDLK